ncbi:UNVERIFIED_CONTAM: hypothetical protein H355_010762 [Colinus virginianus]|nr:hypothetical protein H355_010762 [Colinus virginianus]
MLCPSEMMDGRISAIREALDMEGWTEVSIVAYSCKYASSLYSPFRDALASHPSSSSSLRIASKRTYQMDPSNAREAEREAELDAAEGADMLLVKPGLPYLDVVHRIKEKTKLPVGVYHVSGEYAMLKAAAERGWLSEKEVVFEVVKCMRRAGADVIVTYFAKDIARWLAEEIITEKEGKEIRRRRERGAFHVEPCY